jgi:predicted permease
MLTRHGRYQDLSESIPEHLEEKIADRIDGGMSREQADRTAQLEFRSFDRKERSLAVWRGPRWESIRADARFALRQFRKAPGFALSAVLVLAMGIGASASIFTFVNAALLKPLPYWDAGRLVAVFETTPSCGECGLSYPDYQDWKRNSSSFSSFDVWTPDAYLLRRSAAVESLRVGRVSGGFFQTLGVSPSLGRLFTAADDNATAARSVVLPYGTWQRIFGGRPDIVGASITLDNNVYTVIGVLPRDFQFASRAAELWVTIGDLGSCEMDRSCRPFSGIARLKSGTTVAAALANANAIASQLQKQYPQSNRDLGALVEPFRDSITGDIRPILLILLSGSLLLLLIAWVNVASLLIVRGEKRRHEIAVRGALGASFTRLAQALFIEAVLLVVLSVPAGAGAALGSVRVLAALIPERVLRGMPFFQTIGFDHRVLMFVGVASLVSLAICTAAPMTRLYLADVRSGLAHGTRTSSGAWKRFGSTLVVAELALAIVLLTSGGLLGKSFYRILHVDVNFNTANLATLEIDANTGYETASRQLAMAHHLIDTINSVPGVLTSGTVSSHLPVTCNCDAASYRVLGRSWNGEQQQAVSRTVSAGYFATVQTRLVRGRFFTEADDASHPAVVIINRRTAHLLFQDEDPIGQVIGDQALTENSLHRVIGVIEDMREGALNEPLEPAVYYPLNQKPGNYSFLVVRTNQDPARALSEIVSAIHGLDPQIGVRNEFTMAEHIRDDHASYLHRSAAALVGGFATCALLLGVIGLYGVVAYSVSQRTLEIGIRMALGAERRSIRRLILVEAAELVLWGLVLGLAGATVTGRFLGSLLFGVRSWDLVTFTAVTATLGLTALMAAWIPARRAAGTDPMEALRAD